MTQPTPKQKRELPFRGGVFPDVSSADEAVARLLAAGFTKDQITVICSDEAKERHFREFEHEQPAGTNTPAAAAVGSTLGATAGGVTLAAGLASGAWPLVIVGGAALMTGGVLGGFLGAMATRGLEKEPADYYDQAVLAGKLLVAVEAHGEGADRQLARAEQILNEAGAESEPLPLAEG